MTLLADIRDFLRRERLWALLFLLILAIFAFIFLQPEKAVKKPRSEAIENLQLAETRLKQEIRATGGMQEFLAKRPRILWTLSVFTSLLAVVFFSGLVIDFAWVSRPAWRNKLQAATGPPEAKSWGVGTVFKTILIFILATLSLSVLLSFLKSIFLYTISHIHHSKSPFVYFLYAKVQKDKVLAS